MLRDFLADAGMGKGSDHARTRRLYSELRKGLAMHSYNPGAAVLLNNQLMTVLNRPGGGGKPPKWFWIIPVVIFIFCLLFMWWIKNVGADDFGKNSCGMPCYAGGCPSCWKDECKEATKKWQDYLKSGGKSPSWVELFLVQEAAQKCRPPTDREN